MSYTLLIRSTSTPLKKLLSFYPELPGDGSQSRQLSCSKIGPKLNLLKPTTCFVLTKAVPLNLSSSKARPKISKSLRP
jgi:hypothetical protein